MARNGIVHLPEEGEQRWFAGGGTHRWLAKSAETDGEFFAFEDTMGGGKATPLHSHPTAESLYVLDGEIVLHLDGEESRLGSGSFASAPAGVPHAFRVLSSSARILFLHTPGPSYCEAFYLESSEPLADQTDDDVDLARVRASAEHTGGMTLLGPPPFAA